MTNVASCLRPGSKPHNALRKLYALAGQATQKEWLQALKWKASTLSFEHDVIFLLVAQRMVFRRRDVWSITDAGCSAIGITPDAPCGLSDAPAPPRELIHRRPLSRQNMPTLHLAREGSLDYRDIPSRVGDTLIPHRRT